MNQCQNEDFKAQKGELSVRKGTERKGTENTLSL